MILPQALEFLSLLANDLDRHQIKIEPHWDIDHLCYRAPTEARYQELKVMFSAFSKLLIESPVNGRLISTFKLDAPIPFRDWVIDLIELPAPKAGKTTPEGFEHIEVVCDAPFSDLQQKYAQLNLSLGGLKKNFNQELEITLGARNLKFHHLSLLSVIRLEANRRVWSALEESQLLEKYRIMQPLVAGTFPLGLTVSDSDVDILVESSQTGVLETVSVNDVVFEVYSAPTPTVQQPGYQHFLAEEKLLKYGGDEFRKRVIGARAQGLKTEPAFAKALGLSGDPYEEILKIQTKSIRELRECLSKK